MNPITFRNKFFAACLATAIAGTGLTLSHNAHGGTFAEQVSSQRAEHSKPAPAPVERDADRYAAREETAKAQQDYQGGNMVIIGISTTAAIVILVIVLLLL
jgi:hypothetical protein